MSPLSDGWLLPKAFSSLSLQGEGGDHGRWPSGSQQEQAAAEPKEVKEEESDSCPWLLWVILILLLGFVGLILYRLKTGATTKEELLEKEKLLALLDGQKEQVN